jgi:hypothetical protein
VLAVFTTFTFLFIWIWSGVKSDEADACVHLFSFSFGWLDFYSYTGISPILLTYRSSGCAHTSVLQRSTPSPLQGARPQSTLYNSGGKAFNICTFCSTLPS